MLLKKWIMQESNFEILVDQIPYQVKVEPFEFNTETRFKVKYNGGEEHIFTWDSSLGRLAPIDDDATTMPDALEAAIAQRLQSGKF
jgi:hypothetical protein